MAHGRSDGPTGFDLNGYDMTQDLPDQTATVGETHRIRAMNIGPAGNFRGQMRLNGDVFPLQAFAKDGADLPENQRVDLDLTPRMGVGETADYTFTPTEPGEYNLFFGFGRDFGWNQKWIVTNPE